MNMETVLPPNKIKVNVQCAGWVGLESDVVDVQALWMESQSVDEAWTRKWTCGRPGCLSTFVALAVTNHLHAMHGYSYVHAW
jgi:hypothetical protein